MIIQVSSLVSQSPNQPYSKLDDEGILLSVQQGKYYAMDRVGTKVWEMIKEPISVSDLCEQLTQVYKVEKAQCLTDILAYLNGLYRQRLIIHHQN